MSSLLHAGFLSLQRGHSLVVVHGLLMQCLLLLQSMGCSMQYQHLGLVAPKHVESSRTRDRTCVPCISRWMLNHWLTRQVLSYINQDREALVQKEKDIEGIRQSRNTSRHLWKLVPWQRKYSSFWKQERVNKVGQIPPERIWKEKIQVTNKYMKNSQPHQQSRK